MPEITESLWSPAIRPDALSPFAILTQQAEALTRQTKGILVGEVRVSTEDDNQNRISLDAVVPLLERFRYRILMATHNSSQVYPTIVDAECFRPKTVSEVVLTSLDQVTNAANKAKRPNVASSDEQFRVLLEKVLRSDEVISVAQSLIARANEELQRRRDKALPLPNESAQDSHITATT